MESRLEGPPRVELLCVPDTLGHWPPQLGVPQIPIPSAGPGPACSISAQVSSVEGAVLHPASQSWLHKAEETLVQLSVT